MKASNILAYCFYILFPHISGLVAAQTEQENSEAQGAVINTETNSAVEEITINQQITRTALKREIEKAEVVMFSIFNDLNEDEKFDIYCTHNRRPGSRIRQQVCAPNFVKTAEEEIAEFSLKNLGFVGIMAEGPGNTSLTKNYNELQEVMEELFKQHSEFNQAVNSFNSLVNQYEQLD